MVNFLDGALNYIQSCFACKSRAHVELIGKKEETILKYCTVTLCLSGILSL